METKTTTTDMTWKSFEVFYTSPIGTGSFQQTNSRQRSKNKEFYQSLIEYTDMYSCIHAIVSD